jgi:hypothetical protein
MFLKMFNTELGWFQEQLAYHPVEDNPHLELTSIGC